MRDICRGRANGHPLEAQPTRFERDVRTRRIVRWVYKELRTSRARGTEEEGEEEKEEAGAGRKSI